MCFDQIGFLGLDPNKQSLLSPIDCYVSSCGWTLQNIQPAPAVRTTRQTVQVISNLNLSNLLQFNPVLYCLHRYQLPTIKF